MTRNVPAHVWLHVNLSNILNWANIVEQYHDVDMVTKENIMTTHPETACAMELTDVDHIDLSFVGKIHTIFDNWLNKNLPLSPMNEYQVLDAFDESAKNINLINSYFRAKHESVDEKGFGMPLIIASFGNALSLNEALIKIKEAKLDHDEEFKETLKTIAAIRSVAKSLGQTNDKKGIKENMALLMPEINKLIRILYKGEKGPEIKFTSGPIP